MEAFVMTISEAEKLLAIAPRDERKSRINPALTRKQATEIIEAGLVGLEAKVKWGDREFDKLRELRVYQAACDLRRPSQKSRDQIRSKAGL
jgi:hypothetical protein